VILPSRLHKEWHDLNLWLVKAQRGGLKPIEKCSIEIFFHAPDRRASDLTNKAESVMDMLVDAGVLVDDNWFVCPEVRLVLSEVSVKEPYTIVKIYEADTNANEKGNEQ